MKLSFPSTHAVQTNFLVFVICIYLLLSVSYLYFRIAYLYSYAGVAAIFMLAGAAVSLFSKNTTIFK